MAVDAFLKFEGIEGIEGEGEGERAGHGLERLGASFADLGGGFIKLAQDASSELLPAVQHKIERDLLKIDQDFFKIGFEFIKLDPVLHKIDNSIVTLTDQFIKFTPSDNESPFPLGADFLKYEADLKITGLDFLATASDIKFGPTESLSLNFTKISMDYKEQSADQGVDLSADQLKIAADLESFIKISGISENSALGMAFLKLSGDSVKLADDYKFLSADFLKIAQDLAPSDGDTITMDQKIDFKFDIAIKFDQAVLEHPDDFIKLGADLAKLNTDLRSFGGDIIKLADAFENPGHVIIPTVKG